MVLTNPTHLLFSLQGMKVNSSNAYPLNGCPLFCLHACLQRKQHPLHGRRCNFLRSRMPPTQYLVSRAGQNRIYTPYMTVYLVISLPRIPCIHRIWPYIWWSPCQKYRIYTVYDRIFGDLPAKNTICAPYNMVLANPTSKLCVRGYWCFVWRHFSAIVKSPSRYADPVPFFLTS